MMESSIPTTKTRSIFWSDAVERHVQNQSKSVLPRYIAPPLFLCLWGLLLLLVAGSGVAWATQVPIYTTGVATVVMEGETAVLVAFVHPNVDIPIEQPLLVDIERMRERLPITTVGDDVLSPKQVAERFGERAAVSVHQPVRAVEALFTVGDGVHPATYVNSTYPIQIQTGSRRIISLFPVIGQFFNED